ncbi:Carbonic anhydrase [Smittium mucronatum]|uniref:Carbonic anhydrase n=1 Tax=Smittium mucronatum TaxID=133383 RepID=A0A1R0H5F6_9FUNG|nr:Carbonic anhydrase [Smittium mucronatum]
MTKGQSPSIVYIGCSDSRVAADTLFGKGPGSIFMHRNVANTIPEDDLETATVIQYAIEGLGIRDIVVSGHTYCGGIDAVLQNYDGLGQPIKRWLSPVNDIYQENKSYIDGLSDPYLKNRALSQLNVLNVVRKINNMESVVNARNNSIPINVYALLYLVENGTFVDLEASS